MFPLTWATEIPLPSFEGEPKPVQITGKIDAFGELLWNALNEENKVSLFVRYIHLLSGESETRIYNKTSDRHAQAV